MMLADRIRLTGGVLYFPGAVTFDGTADYMPRGGGLTGAADGINLTVASNVKFASDATGHVETLLQIAVGASTRGHFYRYHGDNKLYFEWNNTAGAQIVALSTSAAVLAGAWHNVVVSLKMDTPTAFLYVDGADAKTQTTLTAGTLELTPDNWQIGNDLTGGGNTKLTADMSDFYIAFEHVDLSANIGKFYSGGKVVDVGSDGSLVTGTAAIALFKHVTGAAASDYGTNLGTGGDFTISGALAEATGPND